MTAARRTATGDGTGRSVRGAALIQVTAAILGLTAFTVFVIDYGVVWVARSQAQNAADAGALAGAVSLAYEDDAGHATATARAIAVAAQNPVWGAPPAVLPSDVTYPVCPDGTNACIRVDVYRSTDRQSALPAFFGPLLGVRSQRVRATATAQAAIANASDCLKPWAVADKWDEYNVPQPWDWNRTADLNDPYWTPASTFDRWNLPPRNANDTPPEPDVYVPPSETSTGTGYTVERDYGTQLVLKLGSPSTQNQYDNISSGWFMPVDLPRADGHETGGSSYRDNIRSCNGLAVAIGDTLQTENGNMQGPTRQGMDGLLEHDPGAYWDTATNQPAGGCMAAGNCTDLDGNPTRVSTRLVALPVFNLDLFAQGRMTGRNDLVIVNIIGFFMEGYDSLGNVFGRLTHYPGVLRTGRSTVNPNSAFERVILLVQ